MNHTATHPKRKRRTKSDTSEKSISFLLKNSLLGCGIALLSAAALLFVSSAICYMSKDPHSLVFPLGLLTLYLSALIGGIAAVRLNKSDAFICGSVCGGLLALFFLFLTVFFPDADSSKFPLPVVLVLRILTVFFCILGAWLGMKRKIRPRRRR